MKNLPANLSFTAWCAKAAGCNGGRAHDNGVHGFLCGGTLKTCPGGYNGYEYIEPDVVYGNPKCIPNLFSSVISLSVVLLLFSNGFDSKRDILNGRFSLDDRVCSDWIVSLEF